ncbi:hypothetical protein G6F43_013121 [Rhizopus delemar]|nr:hypothetical protein G6F43_013121 [Rhizopus delemar]
MRPKHSPAKQNPSSRGGAGPPHKQPAPKPAASRHFEKGHPRAEKPEGGPSRKGKEKAQVPASESLEGTPRDHPMGEPEASSSTTPARTDTQAPKPATAASVAAQGAEYQRDVQLLRQHFAVSATTPPNRQIPAELLLSRIRSRAVVSTVRGAAGRPGGNIVVTFASKEEQKKLLAAPLKFEGFELHFEDKFDPSRRQGVRYLLNNMPPFETLDRVKEVMAQWGEVIKASPTQVQHVILDDRWKITIRFKEGIRDLPAKIDYRTRRVSTFPVGACFVCRSRDHTRDRCSRTDKVQTLTEDMARLSCEDLPEIEEVPLC